MRSSIRGGFLTPLASGSGRSSSKIPHLLRGKSSVDRSVLLLVVTPVVGQEADLNVPVLVVGLSQELADGLPFRLKRG